MMLLNPLWSPPINLYVMNESLVLLKCALGKLASAPSIRHQVIMIANVLVELATNARQRPNQMVQSASIGVNEDLISIGISRETKGVIRLWHSV